MSLVTKTMSFMTTSTATARAFMGEIKSGLLAAGAVQTSDTGQVDPPTANETVTNKLVFQFGALYLIVQFTYSAPYQNITYIVCKSTDGNSSPIGTVWSKAVVYGSSRLGGDATAYFSAGENNITIGLSPEHSNAAATYNTSFLNVEYRPIENSLVATYNNALSYNNILHAIHSLDSAHTINYGNFGNLPSYVNGVAYSDGISFGAAAGIAIPVTVVDWASRVYQLKSLAAAIPGSTPEGPVAVNLDGQVFQMRQTLPSIRWTSLAIAQNIHGRWLIRDDV